MPQYVLGRAITALATVLGGLLNIYWWIVFISVLLTWVNPDPRNPIVHFLYSATDPVLSWIRRRLPFVVVGNFDLSPLVLLFAIYFVQLVLVDSLLELASRVQMAAVVGHAR